MSTTQPERPTCATCPYWYQMAGGPVRIGNCQIRPPQIVDRMAKSQVGDETVTTVDVLDASRFPVTEECDWCGEHPDFPAWLAATRGQQTPRMNSQYPLSCMATGGIESIIADGTSGLRRWRKLSGMTTKRICAISFDEFARRNAKLCDSLVGPDADKESVTTLYALLRNADKFGFSRSRV